MVAAVRCSYCGGDVSHNATGCPERGPNVVPWRGITKLDLPIDQILERAKDANLETVVVLGWTPDGEVYFASSTADGGNVLWLMEWSKKALLESEP